MEVKITSYDGITLRTKNKKVDDDISVLIDESLIPSGTLDITENGEHDVTSYEKVNVNIESGGEDEVLDSVAYYKATRNKNYPYLPLPSEMQDEQDTIYMLYDATGYMCCPVFKIAFTDCVCTIQKYMNTTLVSEYVDTDITNGTTKYMQFSEEDSDYNTYNYIVIKLQASSIRWHYINESAKFNDIYYKYDYSNGELIEVSGKCQSCDVKVINTHSATYHRRLEYYSFLGVNTTNMSQMFNNCSFLKVVPELDTSNVTNMYYMFVSCYNLQSIPQLDTSKVTNMNSMFNYCKNLTQIPLLNTSNVTNMSGMFGSCDNFKTMPLLNTSNVTDMSSMFSSCYNLKTIPLLNTSNVTTMRGMFNYCNNLTSIPLLDTSKVTDMSSMLSTCRKLQTIPQLNTSNVTNMDSMFRYCELLHTIPQLNTSNVTNMSQMVTYCSSLKVVPELDTSNVTNMSSMCSQDFIIVKLGIINMKVSFDISKQTMLSQNELVKILNNLSEVTTTQTLTLGSTNLKKLTDDEKAIATNKGWTLA